MAKLTRKIKRNYFSNRVPIYLSALFVLAMLLSIVQPNLTGHAVAGASCVDEDGDNPLSASSTIITLATGVEQTFTDSCVGDKVLEYTCEGNVVREKTYDCPCSEGYCQVSLGTPISGAFTQPSTAEQPRRRS